jgi:hypothetical protein
MTRHLLRIDSLAGLLAGTVMLVLSGWLSTLYALPRAFLLTVAAANLAYGTYSGFLSRMPRRPSAMIVALVVANGAWAVLCIVAAWRYRETASVFGLAQLIGEGAFVGGLAALDWRNRAKLVVGPA